MSPLGSTPLATVCHRGDSQKSLADHLLYPTTTSIVTPSSRKSLHSSLPSSFSWISPVNEKTITPIEQGTKNFAKLTDCPVPLLYPPSYSAIPRRPSKLPAPRKRTSNDPPTRKRSNGDHFSSKRDTRSLAKMLGSAEQMTPPASSSSPSANKSFTGSNPEPRSWKRPLDESTSCPNKRNQDEEIATDSLTTSGSSRKRASGIRACEGRKAKQDTQEVEPRPAPTRVCFPRKEENERKPNKVEEDELKSTSPDLSARRTLFSSQQISDRLREFYKKDNESLRTYTVSNGIPTLRSLLRKHWEGSGLERLKEGKVPLGDARVKEALARISGLRSDGEQDAAEPHETLRGVSKRKRTQELDACEMAVQRAKKERLETIKDRFETMKSRIQQGKDYSFDCFMVDVLQCIERDYQTSVKVCLDGLDHEHNVVLQGFSAKVLRASDQSPMVPRWKRAILSPVVR